MPRILINEKDNTSAGNSGSYANYSVLITGFASSALNTDRADHNGVYEFSSAKDFMNTIGLVAPEIGLSDGISVIYHYGNQMAYELLRLGYKIIYKVLDVVDTNRDDAPDYLGAIQKMSSDDFWEIFRDKASYDFRFITHGLLETNETDEERLAKVTAAKEALDKIYEAAEAKANAATDNTFEITEECLEQYKNIKNNFDGFKTVDENGIETVYDTYIAARDGVKAEFEKLTANGIDIETFNATNEQIANLACYRTDLEGKPTEDIPGRGDCIALIELDEKRYVNKSSVDKPEALIIKAINKMPIDKINGKYCALTVPSVYYNMPEDENNSKFTNKVINTANTEPNNKLPGAFHYLACFINSLQQGFNEWYATAGYTRGVSSYSIKHTTVKLGEIAINALEPRSKVESTKLQPKFACNVIACFRGSYYLWGNRTAMPLDDKGLVASHFLNIRQLCTTIKKQLYVACRKFTFDPNSDTLWFNFVNAIKPTLEAMKADQGVKDYKILKVYEQNPQKATLKAKIRIIPIEAVEDFDLEVSLEDSFGETAVSAAESV
jgi:hypothetical protein